MSRPVLPLSGHVRLAPALLAALLVLTACGAPTGVGTGPAIVGTVLAPAGCRPVAAGAEVVLADLAGVPLAGVAPGLVDAEGRFALAAPRPGVYKVLARAETADGRPAKLAAVAPTEAAAPVAVDGASTLVAAGVEPGDAVAPAALAPATKAAERALRRDAPPDWGDERSVRHRLEALADEVAELRAALAAIGPGLADLRGDVDGLAGQVSGLRSDLDAFRDETRSRFEAYGAATDAAIAETRAALDALRAETAASIAALRGETQAGFAAVDARLDALAAGVPAPTPTPGGGAGGPAGLAPLAGDRVATLAGGLAGYVDAAGAAARFATPRGVAVDLAGNVYVADFDNHRIRRVSPAGVVSTFAGDGYPGVADGPGAAARFDRPIDVAVAPDGFVIVADWGNNRIRRIAPNGAVATLAGSTPGFADATGAAARFRGPVGVGVDARGNVFVADGENHRVRRVAPDGVVTTWAGSPTGVAGWLDGPEGRNQLYFPADVAVAADGAVYVADAWNHAVRRISTDRELVTIAGAGPGFPGFVDGVGRAARFNRPTSLAIDAAGDLYVADRFNHAIRKVSPLGAAATVAGAGIPGWRDDAGRMAEFNAPTGVALDGAGGLAVADAANQRVRRVGP